MMVAMFFHRQGKVNNIQTVIQSKKSNETISIKQVGEHRSSETNRNSTLNFTSPFK
jgi:hypothetical protein